MLPSLLKHWDPDSWREKPHKHIPEYVDNTLLDSTLSRLSQYPALVPVSEIRSLREALADVAQGKSFVLQAGDCAERFSDMQPKKLRAHYQLLETLGSTLESALAVPVIRIGRIAGQYAKPRSQPYETQGDEVFMSYYGDIINDLAFSADARQPDPLRLETAYFHAAASLNYLRSLAPGSVAYDSHYYVSHEALLLPYEQTQLQQDEDGTWFCGSGHFLWIGERTRQLEGAHVEFLRGVGNPIGVKVGPACTNDELLRLIDRLNPENIPGRLTLITRFGHHEIQRFPALLERVQREGRQVIWLCDPMHGNGMQTESGLKTRHYAHIAVEMEAFFEAHKVAGSRAGGVHLELSAQAVTECLGGPENLEESGLLRAYQSSCDPRLNPQQGAALVSRLATMLASPPSSLALKEESGPINLAECLATARPENDNLCYIGPGFSLSYRELNIAVRRRASHHERQGVKADERVLIALNDGPELVIEFYAVLALGALPVVINPRFDKASLLQIINDFMPILAIRQPAQQGVWPESIAVSMVDFGDYRQWVQGQEEDATWNGFIRKPWSAPALIQCTSGSTGSSKGVVHSAQSMLAICQHFATEQLGIHTSDILYSPSKAFFGYGMGNSLFFPLFTGACSVLDADWPDAQHVVTLLRQFQPSVMFAVPNLYRALLDYGLRPEDTSLRLAFSAGAALPAPLAARWRQLFGSELYDGIGCTELGHIFATNYPAGAECPGSVGRMLPCAEARIVDDQGNVVAIGERGILMVKSPTRASGYWDRPEEQQANFQGEWYCTGDLFSQDALGNLIFHGRKDDRFKVNGRWVVPIEIENLVMRLFPELGSAYLVPVYDQNEEVRPALILGNSRIHDTQIAEIRTALEQKLERFKWPVRVVCLAEIPINKNNKPDRRTMAKLAVEQHAEEETVC
ncbi:3-deoxy-7-phosphoheptulonate synthase [Lonsdalea quercina]|uniref:3-deoxy-7-phosphoheptulonate synthase n=1 Tax=Lonsdalea quercina TaxID=71657 RepID=UPI00397625A6